MNPDDERIVRANLVSLRDNADAITEQARKGDVATVAEAMKVIDTTSQRMRSLAERALRVIDQDGRVGVSEG